MAAVQAGDESTFGELLEPHRRELQVHCYRMLGSLDDSEDLVQETFLRAWRHRRTFEGRSAFPRLLYGSPPMLPRRPGAASPSRGAEKAGSRWPRFHGFSPTRTAPGRLAASDDEPEEELVEKETIELAFIAAIQLLPPRQRAVLISRDVLGWSAAESAALLGTTVASVNSALQRARATMKQHLPRHRLDWAPSETSREERELLQRYVEAADAGDPAALIAVLWEDAFAPCLRARNGGWAERTSSGLGSRAASATTPGTSPLRRHRRREPAAGDRLLRQASRRHRVPAAGPRCAPHQDHAVKEIAVFPLEPLLEALGLPRTL